jgi:hypothetical protein
MCVRALLLAGKQIVWDFISEKMAIFYCYAFLRILYARKKLLRLLTEGVWFRMQKYIPVVSDIAVFCAGQLKS